MREGEAKAREAQLKRSVPQPKTPKGQFTQKQLLLEAIQTEVSSGKCFFTSSRVGQITIYRFMDHLTNLSARCGMLSRTCT